MSEPYTTDTLLPNPQDDDHDLLYKLAAKAYALASGGGGSATTPGGISGQGQYNKAGAFGGFSGLTIAADVLTAITLVGANNATPLTVTGGSITGAGTTPFASITGTWNTTGVVTAFLLNVTNGASGASSLLMDLQVGAVSKLSVDKSGNLTMAGSLLIGDNNGLTDLGVNTLGFRITGGLFADLGATGFSSYAAIMAKNGQFGDNISISHNGTSGTIATTAGALVLTPFSGVINLSNLAVTAAITPQSGYVLISVAGVATKFLTG